METELTRGLGRSRNGVPGLRVVETAGGAAGRSDGDEVVIDLTVDEARAALFTADSGRTLTPPDKRSGGEQRRRRRWWLFGR